LPLPSTATQNDADEQETEMRGFVPLTPTGALHELPLNLNACPVESTAAQNEGDGHETVSFPPPRATGVAQELPLYVTAKPEKSSAAQKDEEGHDTEPKLGVPPVAGALQALPL
jgi:hypothetical protein